MYSFFRAASLLVAMLVFGVSGQRSTAAPRSGAVASTSDPHLTLSIEPAVAPLNTLVTLQIAYHGVGLYDTTVRISPENALVFDPARSMPCRYNEDASACTRLTLRARAPGVVTISASAYGEIYDLECQCWRFTRVGDDGPVQVTITGTQVFIPLLQR